MPDGLAAKSGLDEADCNIICIKSVFVHVHAYMSIRVGVMRVRIHAYKVYLYACKHARE
jgi:hypothetical protein